MIYYPSILEECKEEHPPPITEIIPPRTLGCFGLGKSQGVTAIVVCHVSSSARTIPSVMLNIQLLEAWLYVTVPPASPERPRAKGITTTSQRVSDFRECVCFSLELHQKIRGKPAHVSSCLPEKQYKHYIHTSVLCILDYLHVGDKGTAAQSN